MIYNVLASSVIDCGFNPGWVKPKTNIGTLYQNLLLFANQVLVEWHIYLRIVVSVS